MRGAGSSALAALVMTVAATAPGAGAANGDGSQRAGGHEPISWAHPAERAPIRRNPAAKSKAIVSTQLRTEGGFSEVYLVIGTRKDAKGHVWHKVRIPMRPNGRKGWVRRSSLGPLYPVHARLVIDRSDLDATLYKKGRKVWKAPVGIGASRTPTPKGRFWIREKFKVSASGGLYGPRAFGTSAYSVLSEWPKGGVIGIHGTDQPSLVPGRPSHGCIRIKNDDIKKLYKRMGIGTPVRIK